MNNKLTLTAAGERPLGRAADDDHLDSWKEIASYLRREVRTVQLWEKKEALPVHRHFHKRLGSVYALRSEIENWKRQVSQKKSSVSTNQAAPRAGDANNGQIAICVTAAELPSSIPYVDLQRTFVTRVVAALERLNENKLVIVDAEPKSSLPDSAISTSGTVNRFSLKCRVGKVGSRLQIHVMLARGHSDDVLWSQTQSFDEVELDGSRVEFEKLCDGFADRCAPCIWLKVSCSPAPVIPQTLAPPRMSEKRGPREAYLKGRYFWNQRNEEGLRKAIRCFEQAIHEDPNFALPYSGLADALTLLSFYEIVPPSEAMPSARDAALHSIELNPNLAEAHASLGDVLLHFDRDWQGADREYRCAIQCNPEYALGYHWYSNLLAGRGEHEAAEVAIMQALEIDPVSIICMVWAGYTAHLAHRFDEAIKHYRNALELDPRFIWAHMYLGQALEQKGEFGGAVKEFETAIALASGSDCVNAMKAHTHALAGNHKAARRILREVTSSPQKCVPSYDIAATYAALDQPEETAAWLKRACNERSMKLFTLPHDPRFDAVRNRPDFESIIASIGIKPQKTSNVNHTRP